MKSTRLFGSLLVVVASLAGACFDDVPVGSGGEPGSGSGSGSGGSGSGAGTSCSTSSDCATGETCGFPSAEVCEAKGECFATPGAECAAYSAGCACDGTEINVACTGLPTGYDTKPLAHAGACTADASTGTACTTDADCSSTELCGFEASEGCSAKGQCFASPGVTCEAYSPGCACDGTEINIACNGLPTNYDTKPLAHTGACADGGSVTTDAGGGTGGTGVACTSTAGCGTGELCGFAQADACTATGECFVSTGAICNSFEAGCACDGSVVNLICNGLPEGYDTSPVAHTGACSADAGQ